MLLVAAPLLEQPLFEIIENLFSFTASSASSWAFRDSKHKPPPPLSPSSNFNRVLRAMQESRRI